MPTRFASKISFPAAILLAALFAGSAMAQSSSSRSKFPPSDKVLEGFTKVVSSADGKPSLYTLWINKKTNQMYAELPRGYASMKQFIAVTTASGERYAGLQGNDYYVYWRRYDNRLALIAPNVGTRSTGDPESRASVKRLFTDRVLLDVPIVTENSKTKGPIIDMDALLVGRASSFFPGARAMNPKLSAIKTAKAFEKNVEISFEVAMSNGLLKELHYSISKITSDPSYKPRVADERLGYFTTSYVDLGKYDADETNVRYINRWHLEKADPSLKMSPPKEPIVFYIEHTTPKRYRYWVKQGVLYWNKAFEKVGIRDAIEVYQQDANPKSPKHMDKDPEDAGYNFIRWLNNDIATAIGPSRVNPMTGQILDADIVLTDGWIRAYERQFSELLPKIAMEGYGPRTLAWLNDHPDWDPRVLLAPPTERQRLIREHQLAQFKPMAGHPIANSDPSMLGDDPFDGLTGRTSQVNGLCLAAEGKAFELDLLRMHVELAALVADDEDGDEDDSKKDDDKKKKDDEEDDEGKDEDKHKDGDKDDAKKDDDDDEEEDKDDGDKGKKNDKKKDKKKKDQQILDGIPEDFIGPLISDLVAHEVGHTLGLRHNFKASTVYSIDEINSPELKGKPFAGSVMDYLPINIYMGNEDDDEKKPDHTMVAVGPYDMWAIEYGYTFEKDLKKILARVAEKELVYGTDEDTIGPDPRARRYDFGKEPINYAKQQLELAKHHRAQILDKFVADGDSWSKARRGYEMTLRLQTRSVSMMANWVGGLFVHRDKKGDPDARKPFEVVDAEAQRTALKFVIDNAFKDESFGLTPDLLNHLTRDLWLDGGFFFMTPEWPVHDRIAGIQGSALTSLLNPDTLTQLYDNELRTPADTDMVTLPEVLDTVGDAIWTELNKMPETKSTARKPWISSLRRNLQREHSNRLIDLLLPGNGSGAAYKPISNLVYVRLKDLVAKIDGVLEAKDKLDPYSAAHLMETKTRITKALDAQFIYNTDDIGGGRRSSIIFFHDEKK